MAPSAEECFMGFVGASEEATKTCVDKNELKQCFNNLKDNKDLLKVKQNIQGAGIDSIDKAYKALTDIWAVIQETGADWSVQLAFLMISASWVAVELIKAGIKAVVSAAVEVIWKWLLSFLPSVVGWAGQCAWSLLKAVTTQ